MKSKQIIFFLLPEDYSEIEGLLINTSVVGIISTPIKSSKWSFHETLAFKENEDLKLFLYLKNEKDKIVINEGINQDTKKSYLTIDIIDSPVAEFRRCFFNQSSREIRAGRFYFIEKYFNKEGSYLSKSDVFIDTCNEILKKLKRELILIKSGDFKGFYMSKRVEAWIKKEKGILIS